MTTAIIQDKIAKSHASADHCCPACNSPDMHTFYEVRNVPTNSCILLETEAEARAYPVGDIELSFCKSCGFIFNTAFDAKKTEYSGRYEETQAFSGTFNAFHKSLAQRLVTDFNLYQKDILEIGCGKGEFLALLAELGDNRGVGIDPGVHVERIDSSAADRMKFIPDFYSEKYADHNVDFLACKMTLEHIPDALNFMSTIRRGLGDQTDAIVFFQIPEALRIFRQCAFEDIYYEHCAYFSPGSLARLFRRAGFIVETIDIEYDDQYLTIQARPAPLGDVNKLHNRSLEHEDDIAELADLIDTFPSRVGKTIGDWRARVSEAKSAGKTVALWGSGSKAVSFLSALPHPSDIDHVIDINPYRRGFHMPITAHKISGLDDLQSIRPDLVIVMNRIYEAEIRDALTQRGLSPELCCL